MAKKSVIERGSSCDDSDSELEVSNETLALFERRLRQSPESRLCEYLLGIPLENSDVLWRVFDDHYVVRNKYNLPYSDVVANEPSWYEDFLRDIAKDRGVEIVDRSACGDFFTKNQTTAAVYFYDDKRAGVRINKDTYDDYVSSIDYMEHEIIHSLQFSNTPSMPIEVMEYEAYVASYGVDRVESIFKRMRGSVDSWYLGLSEKAGYEVVPEWDSPEYFIEKVDKRPLSSFSDEARGVFADMKREIEILSRQPLNLASGVSEEEWIVAEIDLTEIDTIDTIDDRIVVRPYKPRIGVR